MTNQIDERLTNFRFRNRADSRLQVVTLEENVKKFGVNFFGMTDKRQGIVHVSPDLLSSVGTSRLTFPPIGHWS